MNEPVFIVYDGECPFCSAYVRMLRLRRSVGEFVLLNAREPHPVVSEIIAAGIDLDEGMAVRIPGRTSDAQVLHGDEAIYWLSLMSTPSGLLNRMFAWLLADRKRAQMFYPLLRAGRNLALRLLGRRKIGKAQPR